MKPIQAVATMGGNSKQEELHTLNEDLEYGGVFARAVGEKDEEPCAESYHPVLRCLMALCFVPAAVISLVLLLLAKPLAFFSMYDELSTYGYLGIILAPVAVSIWSGYVALHCLYAWALFVSACRGATVCSRIGIRWTSDASGIALLLPSLLVFIVIYMG